MTRNEAIDLAITLIREKAECDKPLVRLAELKPDYADRHAVLRFKRFHEAITILENVKREKSHENVS